ncbi:MAG TPA: OadG family protein [Clostridiales bacterium]|nr:OadG family protein [Clostridiales bacterium]
MNMKTKLVEGLQVLALGLGITLIALCLLILVVELINKLVNKDKKSDNQQEIADIPNKVIVDESVEDSTSISNDELVAVISAAIVAMLDDGAPPFKIKNIRRIPASTPRWNQLGRKEQLLNRR